MTVWQGRAIVTALWGVCYSLLAWVLITVSALQQDMAAVRATLVRMERDASEFVTKRELDTRAVDIRRRVQVLEEHVDKLRTQRP